MNTLPKLYFSPYSKDAVRMLYKCSVKHAYPVGLICSVSQVKSGSGYTGFTSHSLCAYVQELQSETGCTPQPMSLCRDHLGKSESETEIMRILKDDIDACFSVVHLHLTDPALINRIMQVDGMSFELGTGEAWPDRCNDYTTFMNDIIKRTSDHHKRIAYLSFPTGCLIDNTHNINRLDHSLIDSMCSYGFMLKGHNSDYADTATLRALAQSGISALNVAPQLGVVMTRAYMTYAKMYGYNLQGWEHTVLNGGEWTRWGPVQYAVELGGQYHFNELPERFREASYQYVESHVERVFRHYMENFVCSR